MRKAIEDCRAGFPGNEGGPFGACIVKDNQIIATAHNTVMKDHDPTAHAEINAIRKASQVLGTYDLSGCEIYSTTEPCPMCFTAIHWARIARIYSGTKIEAVRALGFNELPVSNAAFKALAELSVDLVENVLEEECQQLLEDWAAHTNAATY
ncbi:MAG: nucleoside deaminase [Fidelibacterota bacterium]|nr:MAG: nucleoside deaminase [Candidatus Neomarinimicrobiota bacterium]